MKEAEYYHALDGRRVMCDLCPHHCVVSDGHRGRCRSRVCIGGKLYSEAYGRPCALAIDPIEKKPLAWFHPGTEARISTVSSSTSNTSSAMITASKGALMGSPVSTIL